jgi:hypothetical protein
MKILRASFLLTVFFCSVINVQAEFESKDSVPPPIIYFSAKKHFSRVILDWSTLREENSRYFSVERSANNIKWNPCARLDAAGDSDTLSEYNAFDYAPNSTDVYYRIKLVDWNGNVQYSNVVSIALDKTSDLSIFPLPATDHVNISFPSGAGVAHIQVFDVSGKVVHRVSSASESVRINLADFDTGVYFIKIMKNGKVFSEKMVVN